MKLLLSNCLGDYSYSFQGSSELISIAVTVSLFSMRMQLQEIIPLWNSQEFSAITFTRFNGLQIRIRDGQNKTTIITFQKSFASDVTSNRHLMTHQMKILCVFSVFHCVEEAFGASSGGTQKWKTGPQEMNSKMVVVMVGPSLTKQPKAKVFEIEKWGSARWAQEWLWLCLGRRLWKCNDFEKNGTLYSGEET